MEIDNLVDIRNVIIDRNLPKKERMLSYINQIKDPFNFKYGKYTIEVAYNDSGESFETHIDRLIKTIKNKQE